MRIVKPPISFYLKFVNAQTHWCIFRLHREPIKSDQPVGYLIKT